MKHRFHTNAPLVEGAVIALAGEELHHARVVRVREGEEVEVFDGRGHAHAATMATLTDIRVGAGLPSREAEPPLHLAMSIINLERFELVLQKATELGAASITPLLTDRMEVREERFRGKRERWEKIIFEAVKQCGRAMIPPLREAMAFDAAVTDQCVVYDADEAPSTRGERPSTLMIGPEGGFSPRELALARTRGAAFGSLGPRRLRAETAAIVALALMIDLRAPAHPGR